jgi:hypothetical protein
VALTKNLAPERQIPNQYPIVPLVFMQDNVAASQSDVQLLVAEVASAASNAVDGYCMPWPGTIVGISAVLSAAGSAGTLTAGATVAGTEGADPTLTITTEAAKADTAFRGVAPFAAGDVIGAEITTDGSWNGTTSDLAVTVWVMFEVTGI